MPSLVWTWSVDPDGVFTSSSAESLEMIGYHCTELVGRPCSVVLDFGELPGTRSVMQNLTGQASRWSELIVTGQHKNGSVVWLDIWGRPCVDSTGRVLGFQGSSRVLGNGSSKVGAFEMIRLKVETVLANRLMMTAFQPIVALSTGITIGVEALTRFVTDPAVTPDVWFADAASIGLGMRLELLAVETALAAASELPRHLSVSVNASPSTCLDPQLADLILMGPIAAERIVLELTEHTPVVDYEALRVTLASMRARGVRIAVDDAGAGFASFRHILQLKPELIKLDRAIIADLGTDMARNALGAAMVSFAAQVGARVIAEGIETATELQAATDLGMFAGQGYFLGRPTVNSLEWNAWQRSASSVPATAPAVAETEQVVDVALILDALPDATAILDRNGMIVAVNRMWQMFSLDNGGRPEGVGVGVDYLGVCHRAALAGDQDASELLKGLRAVLSGESVESEWEYRCDSPQVARWFVSRISSLGAPGGGALVSHINITRLKRAELRLAERVLHKSLTEPANRAFVDPAANGSAGGVAGRAERWFAAHRPE